MNTTDDLIPWTHEQIAEMLPRLKRSLDEIADAQPHAVRPLPMLTFEECRDHIFALIEAAQERVLTQAEGFLFSQLIASFQMGCIARHLKIKGRCYVVHEETINRVAAGDSPCL